MSTGPISSSANLDALVQQAEAGQTAPTQSLAEAQAQYNNAVQDQNEQIMSALMASGKIDPEALKAATMVSHLGLADHDSAQLSSLGMTEQDVLQFLQKKMEEQQATMEQPKEELNPLTSNLALPPITSKLG